MTDAPVQNCPALIWHPIPDRDVAASVSKSLLDEDHITCANIVPGIVSLFVWKGARDEGVEAAALIKTNSSLLDDAITRLAALHPYGEPAMLGGLGQ